MCCNILVLSFVLVGLLAPPQEASEDYRIHSRSIPKGLEGEAEFFELIKWPHEPTGGFDTADAPVWNIANLAKYIPAEGIEFIDANHALEGHVSRLKILNGLKNRKGEVFKAFAHLSHIYSIPYKQYSELRFARTAGGATVVSMADWYTLTFKRVGSQPVIVRWEYAQLEGH